MSRLFILIVVLIVACGGGGSSSDGGGDAATTLPTTTFTTDDLRDVGRTVTPAVGPRETNGQVRLVFDTTAAAAHVEWFSTLIPGHDTDAEQAAIAVRVDDTTTLLVPHAQGIELTDTVALSPDGSIVHVAITTSAVNNASSTYPDFTVNGSWIDKVIIAPGMTSTPPVTCPRRLVVLGTSISSGYNSPAPARDAWPVLARDWFPGCVTNEAVASSALADLDPMTIHKWPGMTDLLFECCRNDWDRPTLSAKDIGAKLAALVKDACTTYPGLHVWMLTAIRDGSDARANKYGDTNESYRQTARDVAAAAPCPATVIEGFSLVTYYADYAHPDAFGQAEIAAGVRTGMKL
jgi:hypothetical protein